MEEIKALLAAQNETQSLAVVLVNLVQCLIFGFILKSFFLRYSTSMVAHNHIANIIPILSVVVFLVILIVKSSIALSLGLVGALSIVRFRTPIKEPEELVYLFFAIAIGLGFGAGQAVMTAVVTVASLIIFYIGYAKRTKAARPDEFNATIEWDRKEASVGEIESIMESISLTHKIIRISAESEKFQMMLHFEPLKTVSVDTIITSLSARAPSSNLNIYENQVTL